MYTVIHGLHLLLSVPIRERLVFRVKIDGATLQKMSRMSQCSDEDAHLQSVAMIDAVATWQATLRDVFWTVPTRSHWRFEK
jgi:hypothetical protein